MVIKENITKLLQSALGSKGYMFRVVDASRSEELFQEINDRHARGEIDAGVYDTELTPNFEPAPDLDFQPRSIFIMAGPSPPISVTFENEARSFSYVIPPTYRYFSDDVHPRTLLAGVLGPRGFKVAKARVPMKLLATRTGLSKYGKNNISYIEGFGSFYRLEAAWSDFPAPSDAWQEPATLDQCSTCKACQKACPTGVIGPDRFLVHVERCLTYFNENKPDFPAWIDPSWHNCLVGCMKCQLICPANKQVKDWIADGESFSEEETQLILDNAPREQLSEDTIKKLENLSILEYLDIIGRNLRVLIERDTDVL